MKLLILSIFICSFIVFITCDESDPPNYRYHMSLIMNYSNEQHKMFIRDYFKVPGIVSNPCIYTWPLNHNYSNEQTINLLIFALGGCNGCLIEYYIVSYNTSSFLWKVTSTGLLHIEKESITSNETYYETLKSGKIADPRGYTINHKSRIVYIHDTENGRQQLVISDIAYNSSLNILYVKIPMRLNIEYEITARHEKNWMPFIYKFINKLSYNNTSSNNNFTNKIVTTELFVHSIYPHRVVHPVDIEKDNITNLKAWNVYTVSITKISNMTEQQIWPYGPMHGGSNAILVNTKYGYKYLTIFHSHSTYMDRWCITYFFGFYLFDPSPPFAITHISPVPIIPNAFYNETTDGWSYRSIDYIVFPIGLIKIDDMLYISVGRHDRSGWILKILLSGLIDSLKNVSSEVIQNNFRHHMIGVLSKPIN